jgi:[ribosomal protein S18]-alanine N-acetyltransferase
MIALVRRWFGRGEPALSEARPRDAGALASLHAKSFQRGWSEAEFERLLLDRSVMVDQAVYARALAGFIMSRRAADEAEVLSVAVASAWRRRSLARRLLTRHLRKLAGVGVRRVFLEVDEGNVAARRLYRRAGFREIGRRAGYYPQGPAAHGAALVLRRDLA